MAGAVGLRDVRYGYEGENHLTPKKMNLIHISLLIHQNVLSALGV